MGNHFARYSVQCFWCRSMVEMGLNGTRPGCTCPVPRSIILVLVEPHSGIPGVSHELLFLNGVPPISSRAAPAATNTAELI